MSFHGCYFSFDGIPCTEYGLAMYEFGTKSDANDVLSVDTEIIEDRISRRYTPLHYGTVTNKPLEFTMTFGADINVIESGEYFDRWDMNAIANWLTAHNEYKWLEISQPDMEMFRYKCFITDLKHTDIGGIPWGFTCKVICDSPFAYRHPETFKYFVKETEEIEILNQSAHRGYYKPKLILNPTNGGTMSVENITDNNRITQFTGLPPSSSSIHIDNENEIITCKNIPNPYQYFNFNFLRLCKGVNRLVIKGTGSVEIICEFPVNIGG